jgi:3-hydroxybutyryl-CoA dehydrogenase
MTPASGLNPILTIAVIGAGRAGRAFALSCAQAGHRVILEDVMPSRLRDLAQEFLSLGHAVELVSTVEDAVRQADIAVDFVPDELESKLEIFSMIDRMAPPRTILCTPSEALSITDLASCTYRADRCVMLRGFRHEEEVVRLLHPRKVSDETLATVSSLLRSLQLDPVTEHDPDLPMLIKNMGYEAGRQDL